MLELAHLYSQFFRMPPISISHNQRTPVPEANWIDTVYYRLPSDLYTFSPAAGEYFVFIDRVSPEISQMGKHAKDLGSFAVFCLILANGVYAAYVTAIGLYF